MTKKRVQTIIFSVVILALVLVLIGFIWGRISKSHENASMAAEMDETMGVDTSGYLQYDGKYYEQNQDITSILFMGVDTKGELQPSTAVPGEFGQADTIILALIDKKHQEIRMINVVRDSMVNVTVFDTKGEYVQTSTAQLCLQYAYGDGGELSCQLTANTVSSILYDIPINYYVAVNKAGLQDINDVIGGVTVTMSEDWVTKSKTYKAGEKVTLKGADAMDFIFSRNMDVTGSNMTRVERQRDYIKALLVQLKAAAAEDIGIITKLYSASQGHMYSNIALTDMVGMAKEVLGGDYSFQDVQILPGEYVEGAKHDEYYIDKDAIYELVLQNYYTEVDLSKVTGQSENN